jgi:hypothetical protein
MSVSTVSVTKILLHRMHVSNCQQMQADVVLRDMIKMLAYPFMCMLNIDVSLLIHFVAHNMLCFQYV